MKNYSKSLKKRLQRLVFVGLCREASVFFSILLHHFVALEELEETILKLTWLVTKLVQL